MTPLTAEAHHVYVTCKCDSTHSTRHCRVALVPLIDVRTTYADRGPQTSKPPATVSSRHDPGSPASHGYPRQTRSGVCVGQGLWVQPQASLSSAALVSVERPIEELRTALRCDVPSVPETSSSGEGEERGGLATGHPGGWTYLVFGLVSGTCTSTRVCRVHACVACGM